MGEDPEELWVEDHTDGRVLIMFVLYPISL